MRLPVLSLVGIGFFATLAAGWAVTLFGAPSVELPARRAELRLTDAWRQWQTDNTALAFVNAVADRDSAHVARLSRSGSGHNILCAVRLWPRQHWVPASYHSLYRLGSDGGDIWYRLVGFALPGDTTHAVLEFSVAGTGVPKVVRFASGRASEVLSPAFQACIHQ
jgi:hypothetical protein